MIVSHVVASDMHAACPFSVAEEYAIAYLQKAENGLPGAQIHVPLKHFPTLLHRRVDLTFGLHLDVLEGGRSHDEIRVRWNSKTIYFPNFRGTIRFRIAGASSTTVLVEGSYNLPFGIFGRIFDLVAGSSIAQSSVDDLARRITSSIEHDYTVWRARVA